MHFANRREIRKGELESRVVVFADNSSFVPHLCSDPPPHQRGKFPCSIEWGHGLVTCFSQSNMSRHDHSRDAKHGHAVRLSFLPI